MGSVAVDRCFIALALSQPVRQALVDVQRALRDRGINVRWEPTDKLHITVRFLGDTEPKRRAELERRLRELCDGWSPFDIVFSTLGAFPDTGRPNVIWAGAYETDALASLGSAVEEACRAAGYPPEARPFHPHCTLARVRDRDRASGLTGAINSITFDPVLMRSSELLLMKSVLLPGGSQHTRLTSCSFNA